jgi:hypothetical protein
MRGNDEGRSPLPYTGCIPRECWSGSLSVRRGAQIAEVHAARGDVDQAFQWHERAFTLHDLGPRGTKVSPRLRSLHGDPRWGAFLKKMGFEE